MKVTSWLFGVAILIAQCFCANSMDDVIFDDCVSSKGTTNNCTTNNFRTNTNIDPVQEFIYKCGDEVDNKFWIAPNRFHILYEPNKLDAFRNSTYGFNFTLKQRAVGCEETFFTRTSIPDNKYESGPNLTALLFSPAGYLVYSFDDSFVQDEIYYHKDQYCIQNITDEVLTVRLCKSTCFHLPEEKGSENCLPKCCPFGWILDSETSQCQEVQQDWLPSVYVNRLASKPLSQWNGIMKYVPPDIDCYDDSRKTAHFPFSETRLLANGKLFRKSALHRGSNHRWLEHSSAGGQPFCIDAFWNTSKFPDFAPSESHLVITRCLRSETSEQEKRNHEASFEKFKLQSQISVPVIFLPCALTYLGILIVYLMLWPKQNSQGWTVMAFSASQLLLYLELMVTVGMGIYSSVLSSDSMHYWCCALGIIYNFAFISTYSWTAVLTFDVWGKLSSMKPASKTSKGKKRFFFYICFGVGVPTLIVTIASIMEWGFWEFPEDMVVMPGYSDFCSVGGGAAFLVYQGLPSALLFIGNLVFLVLTFRSLWEAKKNVRMLQQKGKKSSMDNKVVLIVKLMVMMGAFLIFEFLINFCGLIARSVWFTFLQAYRILHAVGLFYLFVCSKKVTKQLREQYPSLMSELGASGLLSRKQTMTESTVSTGVSVRGPRSNTSIRGGNRLSRLSGFFAKNR